MKKFTKVSMSVLAASALLLAGCSGGGTAGKTGTAEGGSTVAPPSDFLAASYDELKDGGELRLSIGEITEQLNPFHGDGTRDTSDIWIWFNPRLSLYDADAKWHFNPNFLSDVKEEVKDGKTVVTWTLLPEAKYNDGTPMDWKAFEATWQANNGSNEAFLSADTDGYSDIESVKPGDTPNVAVVTYRVQYPWWKKNFEYIMHPAMNDPKVFNEGFINKVHPEWGAGPYTIDSIDYQGGVVTFKKNDKFWGQPGKLDKVVLSAIDGDAEINAFLNNQLDAVGVGNKERFTRVKNEKDLSIYTSVSPSLALIQLNSDSEVLKDQNVRAAIMKSIDRKTLLDIRYKGMDYNEAPLGALTLKPFQDGYEDNLGDLGVFSLEEAGKLLDGAGWKLDGDYRKKDGKQLDVRIPSFSETETSKAIFGALQAMLKKAGVNLVIDSKKPTDFGATMKNKDFDMTLMGFIQSNPFGMADVGQVYKSDSTLSKTGLGSPEIDKMLEASATAPDEQKSIELGNKAEKAALAQAGWLPLYAGPTKVATRKGLANLGANGYTVVQRNLIGWKK